MVFVMRRTVSLYWVPVLCTRLRFCQQIHAVSLFDIGSFFLSFADPFNGHSSSI